MRKPLPKLPNEGKLPVTKIDAAVRQLETAITLWFFDGDPVSICTLTFAGYEILNSLTKKTNKVPSLLDAEYVVAEFKDEYRAIIRSSPNFFKHAGKDPFETHFLAVKNQQLFLLDAVRLYNGLEFGTRPIFRVFQNWLWISLPDIFHIKPENVLGSRMDIEVLKKDGKQAFFNLAVPIFVRGASGAK